MKGLPRKRFDNLFPLLSGIVVFFVFFVFFFAMVRTGKIAPRAMTTRIPLFR